MAKAVQPNAAPAIDAALGATLAVTPAFAVHDIASNGPASAHLAASDRARVVVMQRGALVAQRAALEHIADPCTALVLQAGVEYRVRRPGCARGIVVSLVDTDASHERVVPLSPPLQLACAAFAAAVRDRVVGEAAARALLAALVANAPAPAHGPLQQLAIAALEVLHRDLAINHPVAELATELGCSTFHLMHAFRAVIGEPLRAYRTRARVGAALHRLAEHDADLTALALELGFASHSHLTDACVRIVGAPPRRLRALLRDAYCICANGRGQAPAAASIASDRLR